MTLYLGELEQLVLLALVRLAPDAYGVTVRRELRERSGRLVSLGTIYNTLGRLERKGFVTTHLGDPTPERGGRRKKFYRVNALGRRALQQSLAALHSMAAGLDTTRER